MAELLAITSNGVLYWLSGIQLKQLDSSINEGNIEAAQAVGFH
jgi:hypothetical protein